MTPKTLKDILKTLGWKKAHERIGYDRQYVSTLVRGIHPITASFKKSLAGALIKTKQEIDDILGLIEGEK